MDFNNDFLRTLVHHVVWTGLENKTKTNYEISRHVNYSRACQNIVFIRRRKINTVTEAINKLILTATSSLN